MFDRIARRYDLVNSLISLGLHKHWKRITARAAQVKPGAAALDICAGTGDLAIALAHHGARVVALDFAPEMIALGRRRTRSLPISYVRGDALLLPFSDHTFDGATIGFSLRNVASRPQLFAEMARVVRPGGWVVSLETSQPSNRFLRLLHRLYLRAAVAAAGLISESAAYRYLAATTLSLPPTEVIAQEMREAGLVEVEVRTLLFGAAALHSGRTPLGP